MKKILKSKLVVSKPRGVARLKLNVSFIVQVHQKGRLLRDNDGKYFTDKRREDIFIVEYFEEIIHFTRIFTGEELKKMKNMSENEKKKKVVRKIEKMNIKNRGRKFYKRSSDKKESEIQFVELEKKQS